MIIRLSEIDNEVKIRGLIEAERLNRPENSGFRFLGPAEIAVTLRKVDGGLKIMGSVECRLALNCGRCLEEFTFPLSTELDVELAPKALMPSENELELKFGEMDVEYFEGDEIDLAQVVYEEVLLNIPMGPLCGEECRGLCGVCGKNRNYEPCTCETGPATVLAEKLKSFLN
jgi:uncharacterized protein